MKKIILLFLLAAAPLAGAVAQHIALGERVPEVKPSAWLAGQQPQDAELTYVEFFQPANKACITSLDQLKALTGKLGAKLRVIVVTREKEDKITPLLTPYLSSQMVVALDPSGRIFTDYGVTYVPFGVLTDAKNRALWQGNTLQLNEQTINNSR